MTPFLYYLLILKRLLIQFTIILYLLNSLKCIKHKKHTLNSIKSYLYNRKQSVRFNDKLSYSNPVYDVELPHRSIPTTIHSIY